MSLRRVFAAAAILLAAAYLKFLVPVFSEKMMPAVREMIALEQVEIGLPEGVASWLLWN